MKDLAKQYRARIYQSVHRFLAKFICAIAGRTCVSANTTLGVNCVLHTAFIDIKAAAMWGHSGGGFITADAMFRFPEFFKVGISESGVSVLLHLCLLVAHSSQMSRPSDPNSLAAGGWCGGRWAT